jgi:hypothetical protein
MTSQRILLGHVAVALLALTDLANLALAGTTTFGGCDIYPSDDVWNTPVDTLPTHPQSDNWVELITSAGSAIHPDFGAFWQDGSVLRPMGIPFAVVPSTQPTVTVDFSAGYYDESDVDVVGGTTGSYPIPPSAPVEGSSGATVAPSDSDRHVLVLKQGECKLYELYQGNKVSNTKWTATSGAVFDLNADAARPFGWTSADAAGLAIFPGLVKYSEVNGPDEITHAFRFTIPSGYIFGSVWPGSHETNGSWNTCASETSQWADKTYTVCPAMGQRFRLKAGFNETDWCQVWSGTQYCGTFSARNQKVIRALKKYGMMIADGGSSWYLSGEHNPLWDGDEQGLNTIPGTAFEAVDTPRRPWPRRRP